MSVIQAYKGKKKKKKKKKKGFALFWTHSVVFCLQLARNTFIYIKGVLHPRPVFGLFLHFSQKLQHIGNK